MAKIFTVFALLVAGTSLGYSEAATVLTATNSIRQECRFYAPTVAKVNYNEQVNIIEDRGDWHWVEFYGVEGCIHSSALENKNVDLSGLQVSGEVTPVAQNEVTLAGKNFFAELYEFNNPDVKFGTLESIESFEVSNDQIKEFAYNGKLHVNM